MQKRKVGIFGGSFDPVHFGHINLAIAMKEACQLDTLIFVPAGISPFKKERPPVASSEHRLQMLKIAIAPIDAFSVIDWEVAAKGPSYTIDTIRRLVDPALQLHLILGEDQALHFHLWKEVEELIKLAPPLIGSRFQGESFLKGGEVVKIPLFDVSSTTVRERLFQKKYCGHLVPSSVLDYIVQHHLYS